MRRSEVGGAVPGGAPPPAPGPGPGEPRPAGPSRTRAATGLVLGPGIFAAMQLAGAPGDLAPPAWTTAAVALWMATWWITEAIPIPATALLPLLLLPLLGVSPIRETAAPFANPIIFLFMGGFMIAKAVEDCGLHRRMALRIVSVAGGSPSRQVGGFMLATASLSMWISNTATVVMMLPIASSVLRLRGESGRPDGFAPALMLGVAYSASIGGLGTLIGTPPNALLAGFMLESYGVEIGFGRWMAFALPLVAVALPLTWWLLVRVLHPLPSEGASEGERDALRRSLAELGPLTRAEMSVGTITAAVALSWVLRPQLQSWLPGLSDAGIAIGGALALFACPVHWERREFALSWRAAATLPWAVLVLFGGGLALASAIQETGLADALGTALTAAERLPFALLCVLVATLVIFLTELTSNTATAAAFLPVLAALATGIGAEPLQLAIPAALAASCAFMLPVATPPNAIVYGSGAIGLPQMARAGVWLNLTFCALVPLFTLLLGWIVLDGSTS